MGTRLGQDIPKALVSLGKRPLLVHTLEQFHALGLANDAVIAVPHGQEKIFQEAIAQHLPAISVHIIPGGAERQDSVRLGLAALNSHTDIVVIHDAARPFPPSDAVRRSIELASESGAATVAIPCSDTILQTDADQMLLSTPDRTHLWACQTPQTFSKQLITAAHEAAHTQGYSCTDDASLVKWHGAPVALVPGSDTNLKITTPEDLRYAQFLLRESRT